MPTIGQFWFYMLVALVAGIVVGAYLFRSLSGRQSHNNDVRWRRRLDEATSEHEQSIEKLSKTLQIAEAKQDTLRQALRESDETVQVLSADRTPAHEKEIADRNTRIAQLKRKLSHARASIADAADQEETLERQIKKLETSLSRRGHRIDELLARNAEFSGLRQHTSDQELRSSKLQAELEELTRALDQAHADLSDREQQFEKLSAQTPGSDYQRELKARDSRLATLSGQFGELRKKLPALNDALREREASIDDLIAELSRERNKIYSLEQAVAQTRSVDSGPVEVERTGANVIRIQQHRESGAPATEAQLSNAPDYYEQQVRELQAELQEWKHKYEASRQNKDHITTKLSARRKSIGRRTTKREKDNLKMIYGIGPVLETTLNELGFFQIDQLADIDDNDIERFATHDSSLPGRLRRDKWVEQAKKLRGSGQPDRRRPRA